MYVDGENFLHRVVEVFKRHNKASSRSGITSFNFRSLFESVLDQPILEIKYYGARVKQIKHAPADMQKRIASIIASQRKLKRCLMNQNIEFRACGLLSLKSSSKFTNSTNPKTYLQEKGVDVGLAVDLIVDNLNNQPGDTIYLVSSDTDLLPAIRALKSRKCKIVYVGFSHLTAAIVGATGQSITIRDQEILNNYN